MQEGFGAGVSDILFSRLRRSGTRSDALPRGRGGRRNDVGNIDRFPIGPKRLEIIEFSGLFVEQMDDDTSIIQYDPPPLLVASDAQSAFIELVLQYSINFRTHGRQLAAA